MEDILKRNMSLYKQYYWKWLYFYFIITTYKLLITSYLWI
jgi:hypothetical protein